MEGGVYQKAAFIGGNTVLLSNQTDRRKLKLKSIRACTINASESGYLLGVTSKYWQNFCKQDLTP